MEERYVRLARLPEGLEFPNEFADRVFYDATNRGLVCRGTMSNSDYQRLVQINGDHAYQVALKKLFMVAGVKRPWAWIVGAIAALGAVVAALIFFQKR